MLKPQWYTQRSHPRYFLDTATSRTNGWSTNIVIILPTPPSSLRSCGGMGEGKTTTGYCNIYFHLNCLIILSLTRLNFEFRNVLQAAVNATNTHQCFVEKRHSTLRCAANHRPVREVSTLLGSDSTITIDSENKHAFALINDSLYKTTKWKDI